MAGRLYETSQGCIRETEANVNNDNVETEVGSTKRVTRDLHGRCTRDTVDEVPKEWKRKTREDPEYDGGRKGGKRSTHKYTHGNGRVVREAAWVCTLAWTLGTSLKARMD
jgi:hypothetical protein